MKLFGKDKTKNQEVLTLEAGDNYGDVTVNTGRDRAACNSLGLPEELYKEFHSPEATKYRNDQREQFGLRN